MDQYFEDSESYSYGYGYGYSPTEQQGAPGWAVSPMSSVPMSRGPSGESMFSTSSLDQVETPCSEYIADQMWFPADDTGRHFTDLSQTSYRMTGIPPEIVTGHYYMDSQCYNQPTGFQVNPWAQYVADQEHEVEPAGQPSETDHEDYSTDVPRCIPNPYGCEVEGCGKTFKRKADRDRHHLNVHTPLEEKEKYPCDWKKCQRAQDPFGRTDHQRDHFRDFHGEDVMWRRPSNKNNKKFWETRKVNLAWWRCSRCLERVSYAEHQYECPSCKGSCEVERQRYRNHIAAVVAQGGLPSV